MAQTSEPKQSPERTGGDRHRGQERERDAESHRKTAHDGARWRTMEAQGDTTLGQSGDAGAPFASCVTTSNRAHPSTLSGRHCQGGCPLTHHPGVRSEPEQARWAAPTCRSSSHFCSCTTMQECYGE
jgi:hypothetical protein